MLRKIAAAALLSSALCAVAPAQEISFRSVYPAGAIPVNGASGNVANASAAASLPATAGATNYVCGFSITSSGSTAAAVVSPTLAGVVNGPLTFTYASVAGATLSNQPVLIDWAHCIPASGQNVAITITLPALGAGNTNATVNIWGFRL